MGGARWHRQDWHRLSIAEKVAEQRRRHDEQFIVREYRCRRCITVVDGPSRPGHLRRCRGIATPLADADLDYYFDEVTAKGAGWRVDAAAQSAVQQAAGGSMEGSGQAATSAEKRAWAAAWARDAIAKDPAGATGAAMLVATKARFGSGISHRVCGAIMRDARGKAEPGYMAPEQAPPRPAGSLATTVAAPAMLNPMTPALSASPPASVVGDVLELIQRMRALGVSSFRLDGREYAVP